MKYRWEARLLQPILWTSAAKQIPLSERFFIGGENSVRGYKAFDMGPHYHNGDPKGGISYSVLSVEYLHELLKIVDGFVFIDAGSISLRKFELPRFRFTYGGGLRIEVMNRMPITVGYGIPVNAKKYHGKHQKHKSDRVQEFYFSMGGQF
jgi:outer membrane protein insertion porin family